MKITEKEELMEIRLHELMKVAGGAADDLDDIDAALDAATNVLNDYMNSLLDKYHCGEQDYDALMAQLTAEEKDKIKELKKNIFNVIQPVA